MKRILFVAILALLAFTPNAQATHIMGGNISYTNLGYDSISGMYEYEIRLNMYRDCYSIIPFSFIQPIWVYEQDTANPTADKNLVLSHNMFLTSTTPVNPPNQNDSCEFISNICVEEGLYVDTIQLPGSPGGFHVIADICCRDGGILNLLGPGSEGINYYTFIAPTDIINTSPQFPTIPVPYLCAGDTTNYSNTAFDSDGDSLVYSFATPFAGTAVGASPPTPNPYPWPISPIVYVPGYSSIFPFDSAGVNGIATIDPLTGVSTYLVPLPGDYVVAVQIEEYRNGVLIGVTRRDLQIIAINCSNNPAPNLDASVATNYTITAGDTICFDVTFNDANNDSLFLTSSGNIFNSGLTNPPAFLADTIGEITITSEFCWYTTCDQDRAAPYQFIASASDDGCPAKVTNEVFSIQVNPFDASPLNGPDTLCENMSTGITYDVAAVPNGTYQWTTTNGIIVSGDSTEAITVDFPTTGNANVTVIVTNANGCIDTLTKDVFIKPNPTTDAGIDQLFCSEDTVAIGSVALPGYTYSWSPTTGISTATASDPNLTLINTSGTNDTTDYILTATFEGCSNTDTVQIIVYTEAISDAGADQRMCSGDTVTLGAVNTPGFTYAWTPATGLSNTTVSDPNLTLVNNDTIPDTLYYSVLTTDANGCTAIDSTEVIVGPEINANAGADPFFCSEDTVQIGSTPIVGYSYSWLPLTGIDNPATANPNITLSNATTAYDTSQYILFVSAYGCVSSDTVDMIVKPLPVTDAGADQQLCSGDTIQIGSSALPGYTYSWSPTTGISDSTIADPMLTLSSAVLATFTYSVTTQFDGCTNTDSVDITINPLPVVIASVAPDTICSGQSATLTGSGANTYIWEDLLNPGVTIDSIAVTSVNPTVNTSYLLIGTISTSCILTDTVSVFVNSLPTVTATIDKDTICVGDSITLIASGTLTYDWTDLAAGSSVGTLDTLTLTPGTTTDYVLTGTDANGCNATDTVSIIVIPIPTATAGSDQTVCSSDTVNLGAPTVPGDTYVWTPGNNLNDSTISDPYAILLNVGPTADTTVYSLTVTSFSGCSATDDVQIITEPLPVVSISASNMVICPDSNSILTASGASTYNWYDILAPTTVISSLNPYPVMPALTTTYIVEGTSVAGCISSDTITININASPIITVTSADTIICAGDSVRLIAAGGVTYDWEDLSNPGISLGTTTKLDITPNTNTTYVLFGADSSGCPNSDTITITVNPAPQLASISGLNTVCPAATGLLYSAVPNTIGSTYNWGILNGTIDAGQGSDSISVTWDSIATAYVYVVEVTAAGCVSDTIQYNITITTALSPAAPTGDTSLCANRATGIVYSTTTSNPSSTYTWHVINGSISGSANLDSVVIDWANVGPSIGSVWYEELTITVDTTCYGVSDTLQVALNPSPSNQAIIGTTEMCLNDTATFGISLTGSSYYDWIVNGGNQITGDTTNSITANWNTDGTYVVQVIETNKYGCYTDTMSASIIVNPLPTVSAGADRSFCTGDSVNLLATGGQTYVWWPTTGLNNANIADPVATPSTSITYNVTATDSNACVNTASIAITVNALPIANAGSDVGVCLGSSTTLNASGGAIYSWSPPVGLDNVGIASPNANPSITTTYSVIVTDTNNCSAEDSVLVTVFALPTASAGADASICSGTTVTLVSTGGTNYSWNPTTALTLPNNATTGASPATTTVYTVTVSDANGCTDTDDVLINVTPSPVATFITDITVDCNQAQAMFTNTSSDALNYSWNFGDGNTSTDTDPSHTYSFNNQYTITLIAINGMCSDTMITTENILNINQYVDQLPNIFTPNNDNLNDRFEFGNGNFAGCSEITIFNRWGKKVFDSSNGSISWDGKNINSGNDVEEGTYFYVLVVNGIEKRGSVYLTR